MANTSKYLMREVATPAHDDPDLTAAMESGDLGRWQDLYESKTVALGEPRLLRRLPVGTGHLYYGDGEEPCHACGQPVGRPHLEGCDHEACPMCAAVGQDVQIGCEHHEVACHEVVLVGKFGSKRARVTGVGFDEAGAQADAEAKWRERQRKALRDYIADAERKREAAMRIGLDGLVAQWDENIAVAERRLAEGRAS